MPVIAAIALGSNLGDREANIARGFEGLSSLPMTVLLSRGPVIETEPIGRPGVDPGGPYLNSAGLVETELTPGELLAGVHAIERSAGRRRSMEARWSARTLDLDILTYGDQVLRGGELTIPHPGIAQRRFVLEPLGAIAPDLVVPELGRVDDLLRRLDASQ